MRIVLVVQARLGSTRLPAKVLLDLGGTTALARCLSRAARIEGVAEVVVATTVRPEDDLIEAEARRLGHAVVRGSELDVLDRYAQAAREHAADAVLRCTSDCPLLDPAVSGAVVARFRAEPGLAYASNVLERRLPRGLDTEIVSRAALERAQAEAADPGEREHVTLHIVRRPERYPACSVLPADLGGADLSSHRWTLDTLDDYHFLAQLHRALGERAGWAGYREVAALLELRPELVAINRHVTQR